MPAIVGKTLGRVLARGASRAAARHRTKLMLRQMSRAMAKQKKINNRMTRKNLAWAGLAMATAGAVGKWSPLKGSAYQSKFKGLPPGSPKKKSKPFKRRFWHARQNFEKPK